MKDQTSRQQLRKLLLKGNIEVFYQPQYQLSTFRYRGIEALLRWRMDKSILPPSEFLALFAGCGMMDILGLRMIEQVLCDISKVNPAKHGIEKVSVNCSYEELANPAFVKAVLKLIQQYKVNPELLMIELTESHQVMDLESLKKSIGQLKKFGLSIALDDFCTGCSCLNHLRELDVDCIKVDKSFVKNIYHNRRDHLIVHSLISIARDLGIQSVVEGIEDCEQTRLLRGMKADWVQGFHFAKPMPWQECLGYIDNNYIDNSSTGQNLEKRSFPHNSHPDLGRLNSCLKDATARTTGVLGW